MLTKRYILFSILLLLFSWISWTYYKAFQNQSEMSIYAFFHQKRFNGDFYKSFNLLCPDTVVAQIRMHMPSKWIGLACEGAYYNLTSQHEAVPDSIQFQLMDAFDMAFPHDTIRAFTQMIRGDLFTELVQYDTARKCLQNSYDLSIKNQRLVRAADVNVVLARLALLQNNYPEGIKRLLETNQEYSKMAPETEGGRFFELLMHIAQTHQAGGDFAEAKIWFLKAWKYSQKNKEQENHQILASTFLAYNYLNFNQLDSAKWFINIAFDLGKLHKNNYDEARRCWVLAKIQMRLGDCDKALSNFKEARRCNPQLTNPKMYARYDEGLADAYTCIGQLDSALWLYQKALVTPDSARQVEIHAQISQIYTQKKQYELALTHEKQARQLHNRTFTIEKNKLIGRMQAENEIAQEVNQLKEARKVAQLSFIIALVILIAILIIAFLLQQRQKQAHQILTQEKSIIEAREQIKTLALQQAEQDLIAQKVTLNYIETQLKAKESALMTIENQLESKENDLKIIVNQLVIKENALIHAEKNLLTKDEALVQSAIALAFKNELINDLELKLTQNQKSSLAAAPNAPPDTQALRQMKILTTNDWLRFRERFNEQFPQFVDKIKVQLPKLTPSEMRLVMLIKIGFDTLEIANVIGISTDSVYTSRYRLRKKLELMEDADLEQFIQLY
jgi:DNA-binding CsgD family transcriptional regulator